MKYNLLTFPERCIRGHSSYRPPRRPQERRTDKKPNLITFPVSAIRGRRRLESRLWL